MFVLQVVLYMTHLMVDNYKILLVYPGTLLYPAIQTVLYCVLCSVLQGHQKNSELPVLPNKW